MNNNVLIKNLLELKVILLDKEENIIKKFDSLYFKFNKEKENKKIVIENKIIVQQFQGYNNFNAPVLNNNYYIVPKDVALYFKRKDFLYFDDEDIFEFNDNYISVFSFKQII